MIFCDYHVHTNFCDGKNTPEEVVLAAIEKGVNTLGFSVHSYIDFDDSYCVKLTEMPKYLAAIAELKERYADKIKILCGVEQDYYAGAPKDGLDFVIGSVHHFRSDKGDYAVDLSAEELKEAAENLFDGDFYALAEEYYRKVADVAEVTKADIIGHFDLVTKYNRGNALFDESHPRYVAAWKKAADALIKTGKPFEVNCGAVFRGYRDCPYPATEILEYLCKNGAKVILTSDTHRKEALCYQFEHWYDYLRSIGFNDERIITL